MRQNGVNFQHRTPHPSFAKSLSLVAALPSPPRGEGTQEL